MWVIEIEHWGRIMYEKTIANEQVIFSFSLPAASTLVYDALEPSMKSEINELINQKGGRVAVDGYITSDSDFFVKHSAATTSEITVPGGELFLNPVADWIHKVVIRGNSTATIRIFFS